MKKITFLLFALLITSIGLSQITLATYTFDDANSITDWVGTDSAAGADAIGTNPEASLDWNATGQTGGALEISGVNSDGSNGRAFIFELNNSTFDYQGSGSINIAFDIKSIGVYQSAAFHLLTTVSGPGNVNFFDLQGQINEVTWSNINKDINGVTNSNTSLIIKFQIAAGAIADAGGTILIDNIVITGTVATCDDGIKNGDETGVDCGGSICGPCAPTCSDGIQNGDETGVDCGGTTCGPCPAAEPTVSAAAPTLSESQVLSIFSETYPTNTVTNFNFLAYNGTGSYTTVDIESDGNLSGKIQDLSYYGAQWDAVDLTVEESAGVPKYNYVHLDYYATTSTAFNFYLIDATAGIPGGIAAEPRYAFATSGGDETLVQGVWKSVFIPLSHFTNYDSGTYSYDLTDIFQWKFDGNGTLYFDNVYFSKDQVLGTKDFKIAGLNVYPNPTQDSWTVKTKNERIASIQVYDILGKNVLSLSPNTNEAKIDATKLKSGLYFAKIATDNGSSSIKLIKN